MSVAPLSASKLIPDIQRADYESIDAAHYSTLRFFERSAAHVHAEMLHPSEPSKEMNFGTALHCAILEPKRFSTHYAQAPQINGEKIDRRTTAGKRAWAEFEHEHPEAEILDDDDWIAVQRMREAIYDHPIAKQLLSGIGFNEVGAVWIDPETQLNCKALIDRLTTFDGWSWIVDLKTCKDASRREFSRSCRSHHYGAQAAFYLDGCNILSPRARRFCWLAVEKTPPYAVAVYEADDSALAAGRSKCGRWLREYRRAIDTGIWQGYPEELQPLTDHDTEWNA